MQGTVVNTLVYPVKGLHGIETTARGLRTDLKNGVRGDRNYAFYRMPGDLPTSWLGKGRFRVCMNTEGVALPHDLTEDDLEEGYRLGLDQVERLKAAQSFDQETSRIVDTGGAWHLCDTPKPYVSFLNLASVKTLGTFMGTEIDPHRFRMNVWVDGLEPWVELDYATGFEQGADFPMRAGDIPLEVDDLCERCRAIEQSPASGAWDLELLAGLRDMLAESGYGGSPHRSKLDVMGWLAIPKQEGVIRIGDPVLLG